MLIFLQVYSIQLLKTALGAEQNPDACDLPGLGLLIEANRMRTNWCNAADSGLWPKHAVASDADMVRFLIDDHECLMFLAQAVYVHGSFLHHPLHAMFGSFSHNTSYRSACYQLFS